MAKRHQGARRRARPHDIEADVGLCEWVDYCGARMFVVGYTPGGVPYGWVEGSDGSWLDEDNEHPQPEDQFIDPPF
jgi:hypothetical protein